MLSLYALLCVTAVATASAVVRELGSADLDLFVAAQELSLVAFVVPWCPYCQDLAPEFDAAAIRLQSEGWPLARVDCDKENDLCNEYKIPIYPTIRVFHGKNHSIYRGIREADAMVSFMKRHSQPVITTLSSTQDVVEFGVKDNVAVVGYFDEDDRSSNTTFTELAESHRDRYLFGSISNDMFGRIENVEKPSIVMFKSFDEGKSLYTGEFDRDKIEDFFADAASPLIREVGVDVNLLSPSLAAGSPIAFIFAEGKEMRARLAAELRPVAEVTKSQITWFTADPIEYAKLGTQVGLKPGSWPAFAIEDADNDFTFAFSSRGSFDDLNENAIRQVVNDFLAGKLKSTIKSDPVPTAQRGPITNIVTDTYKELVLNDSKDVLVLYYSPTCGHCKAMAPSYEELGELLKPYPHLITVAKIDATSNDVWPRVSSFPTLKLFKSDTKGEPTVYQGNGTVEDLVEFVKRNGGQGIADTLERLVLDRVVKTPHDEL